MSSYISSYTYCGWSGNIAPINYDSFYYAARYKRGHIMAPWYQHNGLKSDRYFLIKHSVHIEIYCTVLNGSKCSNRTFRIAAMHVVTEPKSLHCTFKQ